MLYLLPLLYKLITYIRIILPSGDIRLRTVQNFLPGNRQLVCVHRKT